MEIEYAIATEIRIGPGRIREDIGDIQELADSILQRGLIHPIILDENKNIVAGFRRFLAMRLLKWDKIPYIRRENLSPTERLAIEIEENTKRRNFSWQEEAAGMSKLHAMMVTLHGAPTVGSKSSTGWTVADTAKLLNKSEGKASEDLQLSKFVDHDVVGQRQSRIEALRAMKRTVELETMAAVAATMVQIQGSPHVPGVFKMGCIINDNCKNELLRIPKDSIDLILTDPPYGIGIDKSRWEAVSTYHTYKDVEQDEIQRLLNLVFRMCHNVLKPGRYLFTFCPVEFVSDWRRILIECGFNVLPRPLIWYKQRGSLTDFFTQFAPAYETFLCAWKGDTRRPFGKPLADVFNYPRPIERWHKLERAPGVLSDIVESCSSPNEVILDPFCGGGSTLAASARAFRRYHGVEIDRIAWARAVQRLTLIEEGKDDLAEETPTGPVDTGSSVPRDSRTVDVLESMVRTTPRPQSPVDSDRP